MLVPMNIGACRNGCNLPFRNFQRNFHSPMEYYDPEGTNMYSISAGYVQKYDSHCGYLWKKLCI